MPAHWNQGLPLRTILRPWQIKRRSPRAWLRPSRTARLPHRSGTWTLAPNLFNPLGLLVVTALLTPLTFRGVANPSVKVLVEALFESGFETHTPLLAAISSFMFLSFALGSVPSREDLSSLPGLLLVFGGCVLLVGLLRSGSDGVLFSAIDDLSALAAGLYALPATVAAVAALWVGLAGRAITVLTADSEEQLFPNPRW